MRKLTNKIFSKKIKTAIWLGLVSITALLIVLGILIGILI